MSPLNEKLIEEELELSPDDQPVRDPYVAEKALQETQALLTRGEKVARIGSWHWDLRTRRVAWSTGMFALYGIDPDDFSGDVEQVVAARVHPDDRLAVQRANETVLQESQPVPMEYRIVLPNGTERVVWAEGDLVYDGEGQVSAIAGYVQDITERKQVEEALRESEAKYRQLVETLQQGLWVIDRDGHTTFTNQPMAEMLGYTREEMQGKHLFSFMDEDGVELSRRNLERRQQGIKEQHEFEFRHKDGRRIYALLATGPLTDANGAYCGAIAGVQDITERKHNEAALEQAVRDAARSHDMLLTLSQVAQVVQRCSTPDEVYRVLGNEVARLGYHTAVFSLTEDRSSLRVAYVSLEYALVRQVEQAVELKMANVATPLAPGGCFAHVLAAGATTFQPPTAAFAAEALPAALCPQAESIVSRFGMDQPRIYAPLRAGEQIYGLLVVVGAGLTAADCPAVNVLANQAAVAIENGHLYDDLRQQLEQLVQTQAQLVHAAKLAAIGELAAGVAHEINNPLTGVLGFAEVLLGELPADFSHRHELEIIAAEARRVSRIVRNLLDFARQTHPHRQRVDLNELVRQPLALIGEQLRRSGVVIEENYASDLDPVCLDEGQIGQVLLNLFSNAAQSMPDGGRLTIRTARHNSMALIAVSDTGLGMPADVQERIFEPFFTTKPEGTGLGLSVSLGIVQEHGGRITVESKVGAGSTFTVWLPLEQPGETR